MTLGRSIRIALAERDLNQKQLSELSGVSMVTISQTISGQTKPTMRTIEKLASALGMTSAELVGRAEVKP